MKYIPVVRVPETYTPEQRKDLYESVKLAVREHRPLVIPENVEIMSMPVDD
jgi:hypothetical protein